MIQFGFVDKPQNWFYIEYCVTGGYLDEIVNWYCTTQEEYNTKLDELRNWPRVVISKMRPPMRKGLMRFGKTI